MQSKENKRYYLKLMIYSEREELLPQLDSSFMYHIWKKGDEALYKFQFKGRSGDLLTFEMPDEDEYEFVATMVESVVMVKMTKGEDQFFSHGKLQLNKTEKSLVIQLNQNVYKNVQRTDCRITNSSHVTIKMSNGEQEYECFDVSAGGTSFKVMPEEQEHFELEKRHKNWTLKFNDKEFKIPNFRVAMLKEVDEDGIKFFKVGIQFLDLSYTVEDEIWLLVNKEMKRVYIQEELSAKKAS
jgi:hypothetical protein